MQISYHSTLTKIQKLQNLKKKSFFCTGRYCPKLAGTDGIFSGTKQGVIRTGLLVSTVYSGRTGRYGMELTPLAKMHKSYTIHKDTSSLLTSCFETTFLQSTTF